MRLSIDSDDSPEINRQLDNKYVIIIIIIIIIITTTATTETTRIKYH